MWTLNLLQTQKTVMGQVIDGFGGNSDNKTPILPMIKGLICALGNPFLNTMVLVSSGTAVTWPHHAILASRRQQAIIVLT